MHVVPSARGAREQHTIDVESYVAGRKGIRVMLVAELDGAC
jgi:hypothetical protein